LIRIPNDLPLLDPVLI